MIYVTVQFLLIMQFCHGQFPEIFLKKNCKGLPLTICVVPVAVLSSEPAGVARWPWTLTSPLTWPTPHNTWAPTGAASCRTTHRTRVTTRRTPPSYEGRGAESSHPPPYITPSRTLSNLTQLSPSRQTKRHAGTFVIQWEGTCR